MKFSLSLFCITFGLLASVYAQPGVQQVSLNRYVEFLNHSVEVVSNRFQMVRGYQADAALYRKRADFLLRLPSSGPLEEYYYQKALEGKGIAAAEKQQLNAGAAGIWALLNQLDETCKTLETYVHLKTYREDNLKQSDIHIEAIKAQLKLFSQKKTDFYQQIQQVSQHYQPYLASDPYQKTAKMMERVLLIQKQLLDSLPYYLNEDNRSEWPVGMVQRSMLADEKLLAELTADPKIAYPASSMIPSFKSALAALQTLKRYAVDDHNYAARQSAKHGNEVYLAFINQYNNDLLANYKSFVDYSPLAGHLLHAVAFSPVFATESARVQQAAVSVEPFKDIPLRSFSVKRADAPATPATLQTLNQYVDFINESLRQMHLLQMLVRNYQSTAEYYRDPTRSKSRAGLSYSHDDFKVPVSLYQLLLSTSASLPQSYRVAVVSQAEVLLNILKEMDGLSISLIAYTSEKRYLEDQLLYSDKVLDRYVYLFDTFDQKKEQLYNDLRRIHESYPNVNPTASWYVAGAALQQTMDNDREVLFGIKSYLKGSAALLPETARLEAGARQLIADEYRNLKGLQRLGRSNGLCPYSPYEDLAGNSARFAEMAQQVKAVSSGTVTHPYESFYYFYNNQLVYQYNKFVELANAGLLMAVRQPDVFAFRRIPTKPAERPGSDTKPVINERVSSETAGDVRKAENSTEGKKSSAPQPVSTTLTKARRDTVYVERVRVDTVYVDRQAGLPGTGRSLEGFAPNNMVLLLDVSASMESPFKMPLLKRSIKSLLTLLRPEDQISIVVYSGKARVVLKPTSGSKAAEIARMIDLLHSSGDTDGNEGLRLAYKTANKQYIRGGNNRIVLATDGEFPVSEEVLRMVGENARQDLYLSVFTFGRNQHTGQKLRKLGQLGQGTYAHVTEESADLQLILEAQGKRQLSK
ncbi:hypothetical protein DYBT9275_02304 [Dyadobacter sp. CECT 9275]|uniref:VWFA domain-containing protein n=1 Tax=Dyadobacter helix TaxID=2822344 RepID=A0A916JBK9_9BACT|nr:VWA domain-containing protein [Dyadobacter sp. CECT 9275]CAG4999780.1 hypothetical protein DYBT9275_02304 [Dyadobacter sp. CECT 9275]